MRLFPRTIKHALNVGVVDDVRTNNTKHDTLMQIAHEVRQSLDNEDGQQILTNIWTLRERFEPEVVANENASRSHPVKIVKAAYRARATGASWQMPLQ